jgi:hypothetical protein
MSECLEGVLLDVTSIEIARWECEHNDFDAQGWLDRFGDRVGSGTARLPTGAWIDLSKFCLVRESEKEAA